MSAIGICLIWFASCAFYGAVFAFGYFNSTPNGSWHTAWTVLLLLVAVGATESIVLLFALLIRRWLGYPDEEVG